MKGSLERGRLADLTILSEDPTSVDPTRIDQITVVGTVVGGLAPYGENEFAVA